MIKPSDWKPTDGITLERNAYKAATSDEGSVVVVAGPGAGKTEMLAQRADYLLRTGICLYPRRILAISFKVDAARNLQERVRSRTGTKHAKRFDSWTFHAFAKHIIDNYRPALTGAHALNPGYIVGEKANFPNAISYKHMVPLAIEILRKNPYALNGLRQTYSHIFFDEFQDVTMEQYKLLTIAFGETSAQLTAVGDAKQRIMVFAGALEGIMGKFATEFDALSLNLYQNRRSAPVLQRMQNRIISEIEPHAAIPQKEIEGENGIIEVLPFSTSSDEAQRIAELVRHQIDAGIPPSEIAVLVRQQANLVAGELFDAFDAQNISYRNDQELQDLASEPLAMLIFNFVQVLTGTNEPTAYASLMNLVSVMSTDEEKAIRVDRAIKERLNSLEKTLRNNPSCRNSAQFWKPEILEFLNLVSDSFLIALSASYSQGDRLKELIAEVLEVFERTLDLVKDPLEAVRRLTGTNAVRVLTIHKSKGLEFRHVIVLGVERELFWGSLEETQAEFFVAISRAKERLTLTHVNFRSRPQEASNRWKEKRHSFKQFLEYTKSN